MTGPSPRPWTLDYDEKGRLRIYGDDGLYICIYADPDDFSMSRGNAEYLVRCVNAHEALVAALQNALDTIKIWHGMPSVFEPQQKQDHLWELYRNSPEIKRIEAALALALAGVTR